MILGLSYGYHDSAAALIDDNQILFADHEERYSRKKFDSTFPKLTLKEIAKKFDLSNLTAIAYYEKPIPKLERQFTSLINGSLFDTKTFIQNTANLRKHLDTTPKRMRTLVGLATNQDLKSIPVLFSKHHLSHASSAFFTSEFEEATVIVMDAVGEWNSTTVWSGNVNHLKNVWAQRFPHSIGLFYSAMTQYLGFKVNSGEYKLMGLAPYGSPIYLEEFKDIIKIENDGSLRLNLKFFDFISGSRMIHNRMEDKFGKLCRRDGDELTQWHADIAATTQKILESYVFALVRETQTKFKIEKVCLSGGVALNCVLNSKLAQEFDSENLHIFPASGDAGGAVGAAFAAYVNQKKELKTKRWAINNSLIGREFTKDEVKEDLIKEQIIFTEMNESDISMLVAKLISDGGVIGIFSGRSEFGPRALGNRSILADPRIRMGQIHINQKIKFRESFRPFAPICLLEQQDLWFSGKAPSEYMLRTVQVKSFETSESDILPSDFRYEKPINIAERLKLLKSEIPSVTHLDGSARIQTVTSGDERLATKILLRFFDLTGCPVLINTSFNVRGEPIVGSPKDAIRCFATTGLDALVFDNFIALKNDQNSLVMSRYSSAIGED